MLDVFRQVKFVSDWPADAKMPKLLRIGLLSLTVNWLNAARHVKRFLYSVSPATLMPPGPGDKPLRPMTVPVHCGGVAAPASVMVDAAPVASTAAHAATGRPKRISRDDTDELQFRELRAP
jgi:hypothetical protein